MNSNTSTPMDESRRVRRACHPCKIRKRRCDGGSPCSVCSRLQDECFYESPRRRKRKKTEQAIARSRTQQITPGPSPEALEANSVSALPERLQQKFDQTTKSKAISAWNLGVSQTPPGPAFSLFDVREYTQHEIYSLSDVFFRTMNKVWGFMDEAKFTSHLKKRMDSPQHTLSDPLVFAVALIGSYFTVGGSSNDQKRKYEALDFQLARYSTAEEPSIEIGAAIVLKTLYLRLTGTAYATWRTSCESIHSLETIPEAEAAPEFIHRDKLFWAAQLIHFGIATESGRPSLRMFPAGASKRYKFDDWPVFKLYEFYSRLAPDEDPDLAELEEVMLALASMQVEDDAVRLSQANLVFSFFRRLRLQTENVPVLAMIQVLDVGTMAMAAARRLVEQRLPWWNLVNVPFQFLCTALVMDCLNALGRVRDALDTLEGVASTFPSESTTSALEVARKMASLMRKRKRDEFSVLDRSLSAPAVNGPHGINGATNGFSSEQVFDVMNFGNLDWFTFDESMWPLVDADVEVHV